MFSAENTSCLAISRDSEQLPLFVGNCLSFLDRVNLSLTLKLLTTHNDTVILTLNPIIFLVERF